MTARQLTLFLLKPRRTPEDSLKSGVQVERYPLRDSFRVSGVLFVQERARTRPQWVPFVSQGLDQPVEDQWNASTAAVLVFSAGGNQFACAFGYGRSLLDPAAVVDDFGLRVTINAVNPDRLRSVDLRILDELALTRRVQASRNSSPETFGIDPARDLLRAVTGEPNDPLLARRLTGADALAFYADVDLEQLGDKAVVLLDYYKARTYRARFPWIDNVARIRDPTQIAELDSKLVGAVRAPSSQLLYLAAPEIVDWAGLSFRYHRERVDTSAGHHDLDLETYLERFEDPAAINIDTLNSHTIRGYVGDEWEPRYQWTVYKCLVFETTHGGRTCLLIEGNWYSVDRTFAKRIEAELETIPHSTLPFPPSVAGQHEEVYNRQAAAALQAGLMDKKLVRVALARDPIELCDLFTANRELVHIKRRSSSSTLSHLFAQGRVATEAFFSDDDLRVRARKHLARNPELAAKIPLERPPGADFTTLYAVITPEAGNFPHNLPFFSRLNMVQAVRELRRTLGVKVVIAGIEETAAPTT